MKQSTDRAFLQSVAEAVGRTISLEGETLYLTEKVLRPGEKYYHAEPFLATSQGWRELHTFLLGLRQEMCFIDEWDTRRWEQWIQAENCRAYWTAPSTTWDALLQTWMPLWNIAVLDQSQSCWISVPALAHFLKSFGRTLQDIHHYRFFIVTRGNKQAVLVKERWSGYNEGPYRNSDRLPFFPVAVFLPQ